MAASVNDKLTDTRNAARPVSTTVSGARASGGTTLSCNSLTGWPTASKVHFVTYQIDANSDPVAGTQLDCYGIVSGSDITNFTVVDGTDTGNSVGDVVTMLPTAAWGQGLSDWGMVEHNRDGTHSSAASTTMAADMAVAIKTTILGYVYPVGSVYTNISVSTNPGTLLGFGTWVAFAEGRVMVGAGTSDAVYSATSTGGASTHTLTTAEMPAHTHTTAVAGATNADFGVGRTEVGSNPVTSSSAGGGGAHNNMPPYIVVYMWKRTV